MSNGSRSLFFRLVLASSFLLPAFIGFSGYLLDLAFQRSLIEAEKNRLNTQVYLLLGAAELIGDTLMLPESLTEPRFSQPDSGLYAFVYDEKGLEVWRSQSAKLMGELKHAASLPIQPGEFGFNPLSLGKNYYYSFYYDVSWEGHVGVSRPFRFFVMHRDQSYRKELTAYRSQLWWLLGGLALFLLITQAWIMFWGLKPLKQLAANVKDVEQGRSASLQGQYPKEIQALTNNLNQLLKSEHNQRQRYRNSLSDLAHSLKTPLAVLRGFLVNPEAQSAQEMDRQLGRMDDIISHQLRRATINSQRKMMQAVDVLYVVQRLKSALNKVYSDKNIHWDVGVDENALFHGDEADLMEVMGNILDNACKYGEHAISVAAKNTGDTLRVEVADDGGGIRDSVHQHILSRGGRGDTAQPGQGIGLAVAVDIISSYQGSLEVERSTLGGAKFIIVLPH